MAERKPSLKLSEEQKTLLIKTANDLNLQPCNANVPELTPQQLLDAIIEQALPNMMIKSSGKVFIYK